MSFLNKARAQAQKTVGANIPTPTSQGPTTPAPKPGIPGIKPGIPKPPVGGKPGIPGKPGLPKPGIPKPAAPAPKDETPLAAKANPFLKKNKAEETTIPAPIEAIEKDKEMMAPIEEAKAEIKSKKETPVVKEEVQEEIKEEAKVTTKKEEAKVEDNKKEEVKEEVKETKKKSASKKKTTTKSKDTSDEKSSNIEPVEIPATEIDYSEAMVSIKSNFIDSEWEAFREEVIKQLNEINISSDMTPSALKETISNLSAVRESIWVQYNDTKTSFEKLTAKEPEGLIERIKKLNASGSNAEERKINSILAVMNYKDGAGRNINLFELLDETRERYNFLKSVMESSQYKTNVLVTMLGSLKLEK